MSISHPREFYFTVVTWFIEDISHKHFYYSVQHALSIISARNDASRLLEQCTPAASSGRWPRCLSAVSVVAVTARTWT